MRRATLYSLLVSLASFLLVGGCTDPEQPPLLARLVPNPVVPLSTPQDLNFLGSNLAPGVYFLIGTGTTEVRLEPETVPGHWTFRCGFGFHYIYTFDSLEDFVRSLGSPPEVTIRAFNVGANRAAEDGAGDDLPSRPLTWSFAAPDGGDSWSGPGPTSWSSLASRPIFSSTR